MNHFAIGWFAIADCMVAARESVGCALTQVPRTESGSTRNPFVAVTGSMAASDGSAG